MVWLTHAAGWLAPHMAGSDGGSEPQPRQAGALAGAEGLVKDEATGIDPAIGAGTSSVAESLMQTFVQAYCSGPDAGLAFDPHMVCVRRDSLIMACMRLPESV